MPVEFNSEQVYNQLRELAELELKIAGKQNHWKDPDVARYEGIRRSLPKIFSLDDLKKYHEFIVEELKGGKDEEYQLKLNEIEEHHFEAICKLEDEINHLNAILSGIPKFLLEEMERVSSSEAYAQLERALEQAMIFYRLQR